MKVLILCTGNSCRSQMAEGWLKHFSPDAQVFSAGTHPDAVNKYAIQVMEEVGIDISDHTSNNVNEYINTDIDFVITVCDNAKEICPIYPKVKHMIHQSFTDPADAKGTEQEQLRVYVEVRDQLSDYFKAFAEDKLS